MPYEILFNLKPNIGFHKKFQDVDDNGNMHQATLDGVSALDINDEVVEPLPLQTEIIEPVLDVAAHQAIVN